ncbi:MAG TPA: NAD(P)/FAD-dependent oxidoreductase [Candidatus Polarisedimenticolaceae bacterium]|nr:NAD(P)/FAD-dependent oxidoreductase [Candidatus Polarisedimenticolaceae bacterium]
MRPVDVVVVGAGPAGVLAAQRAAELGASVALVTRDRIGGMAAHDGPIPVRTLAHAAWLIREARTLERYGIAAAAPRVHYPTLLARVREVVDEVALHSGLRRALERSRVTLHENAGRVAFAEAHVLTGPHGLRLQADRIVLCTGGLPRRLNVPGAELAVPHSAAWSLTEVPPSMIVIGGGMTGLQVASIFQAFGSDVQLFQSGPRILGGEDEDVSRAVAAGLRAYGMEVHEGFGTIERLEPTPGGVRMTYRRDGRRLQAEAAVVVSAVGWQADTEGLNLPAAGVALDGRGFVQVDDHLRTSASHVFAAGDVVGGAMIVPPAVLDAHVAATNAVLGPTLERSPSQVPIGGFTWPEYARVGLTERDARAAHDVAVGVVRFDETARTIIDGRTTGFCKLLAERSTRRILGCHVVGERAAEIVQVVAVAMGGDTRVDALARTPLAFPTYAGMLTRAAYRVTRTIDPGFEAPEHRTDA